MNWERLGWRCPLKVKKAEKFPACGRHLFYWKLRDRLRGPFQAKKAKKSCLRQALILLWTEREVNSALSKSKWPKISCLASTSVIVNWEMGWGGPFKAKQEKKSYLRQAPILLWIEREVDGALSKAKMVKKNLPAAGSCHYGVERESPLSSWNLTPYPFRPKAHPLLEARRLVYCGK